MGRPSKSNQRETRQVILDAALELFAERGFHGTGMRDLARAVGVSEASLYHHFASKEALLDAVVFEPDDAGRPAIAPILPAPFAGHSLRELQVWLEATLLGVLDQFAQPREVLRFRMLLSDGVRLAAAGKFHYVERMLVVQQPLFATMERLQAEGVLRPCKPFLLVMSLVGPMMLWRQMLAIGADVPVVHDRGAFVRHHVYQLLRGAAVDPSSLVAVEE